MRKYFLITIIVFVCMFAILFIIDARKKAFNGKLFDATDVYFSNIQTSIINGKAFVPNKPETESTKVKSYDVIVSKPGDYAIFNFDVLNNTSFDVSLISLLKKDPKCISLELPANTKDEIEVCNNLEYTLSYSDSGREVLKNDVLPANSSKNITLKIGYSKDVNYIPSGDVQVTLYDMNLVYDNLEK